MKYNCRYCTFTIEGQTQIIKDILEHEKTHPENKIDGSYSGESLYPLGKKPKCKQCGCDTDHDM